MLKSSRRSKGTTLIKADKALNTKLRICAEGLEKGKKYKPNDGNSKKLYLQNYFDGEPLAVMSTGDNP